MYGFYTELALNSQGDFHEYHSQASAAPRFSRRTIRQKGVREYPQKYHRTGGHQASRRHCTATQEAGKVTSVAVENLGPEQSGPFLIGLSESPGLLWTGASESVT